MKLDQIENVLLAIAKEKINLNIMLWGPNGVGKTQIFRNLARKLGWKFWLEHMPSSERNNIAGIPFTKVHKRKDGSEVLVQELAYPRFVIDAMDGEIVILFDEVNKTPKEVTASILEFINERSINGQPLSDNIIIGLTGNPPDERNTVKMTDMAFNGRVVHIVVDANPLVTIEYFEKEKSNPSSHSKNIINQDILNYLKAEPKELFEFDERDRQLPVEVKKNARNWKERANRIWNDLKKVQDKYNISDETIYELLRGTIGDESTSKFIKYIKDDKKPISFEEIINLSEATIKRVRLYSGKTESGEESLINKNPVAFGILSDACKKIVVNKQDPELLKHSENILKFLSEVPDSITFSTIQDLLKSPLSNEWIKKINEKVMIDNKPEYKWGLLIEKQRRIAQAEKERKEKANQNSIKNGN